MVTRDNTPGLCRGQTQGHRNLSASHVKSVVEILLGLLASAGGRSLRAGSPGNIYSGPR